MAERECTENNQRNNGVGGKGINKMIDPLIAKHDELPAL
jgi:hypothetical protein